MKTILGTMTFGQQVDQTASKQMIDRFLKEGFREIDTAYVYNNGESEGHVGAAISSLSAKKTIIATKVNPRVSATFDYLSIKSQLEASLTRLGLRKVDTLYLHFPDPRTPLSTTLAACAMMHEEGRFRELGLSNFSAWQVAEVWNLCERNGWPTPKVYQGLYNGLCRGVESELMPALRHYGIRFYAYNPLAGGILTGKYMNFCSNPGAGRFKIRKNYKNRYWKKEFFQAINILSKVCEESGLSLVQAAYGWLIHNSELSNDAGDAIIVGASSISQLEENLKAIRLAPLPSAVVDAFENAWIATKSECPSYFRTSV